MALEVWRDIPGWRPYQASNLGRVRRSPIDAAHGRSKPGTTLRAKLDPKGYPTVKLYRDGRRLYASVHRLVMLAFVGPRPPRLSVNHIDGDKANNRIANLEYTTPGKNNAHAYKIGLRAARRGAAAVTSAKLSPARVRAIRRRLEGGETQAAIARDCGVHFSTVHMIAKGRNWGWLE
jgi:hypothetical protein